jgi:hypothetical protein
VRRLLLAAAGLALAGAPATASADATCGAQGRPVVELVLEVDPPDRIIGTTLESHLRAELGAREIDVCTTAAPSPGTAKPGPIARVTLHVEHAAGGGFLATIRIGDLIMDKRVERTINLAKIPADGRPLAVAASTDELLRASWIELTIPDAPPPTIPPPPAVTRAISPGPKRRRPSLVEVGIAATASDFFGKRVAVGGDLWVGFWVHPRLALELRFAADMGFSRSSSDGSARADTLGPGAGLSVSLAGDHDAPLGLRVSAGADLLLVHLVGTASGSAVATSGTQWTGVADVMVRGWARTGPVAWTLGVGPIAALHGVAATDNGATVTAVEGFGGKADAGLFFSFP